MHIPYVFVALPLSALLLVVVGVIGWAWKQEINEMREKYAPTNTPTAGEP
jgi:hypothetical protein